MPNGLPGPLRLTTYLLLAFATAQQQRPQEDGIRSSPPENAALRQLTQTNNLPSLNTPTYRKGKTTEQHEQNISSSSKDERAVATLAPAGSNPPAVRAPSSARSAAGTSAGLQPIRARRLQDWEVENFVLLATVDGSIYARDRNTGKELWKFYSDRPMVETTYARDQFEKSPKQTTEEDYMWIVEPNDGGSLYIFVPGAENSVQKLSMTVKDLADVLSPYESEDTPFVYNAEKRTTLYTLNATDGAALKYFSTGGVGVIDQKSCRRLDNFAMDDDEDECEPTPTLNIGRTEYIVNIQSRLTQENVCTIKYFEWIPNKRDDDLASKYFNTMDNKYIYSRYDGGIFALEHGRNDKIPLYQKRTSSPVVRVFDVVRPQGADTRETPLVILPQPVAPLVSSERTRTDNIFINCTEAGSFYAMSEMSYPSVTDGATQAQCYTNGALLDDSAFNDDHEHFPLTPASLVGVHVLSDVQERKHDMHTIGGPTYNNVLPLDPEDQHVVSNETIEKVQAASSRWDSAFWIQTAISAIVAAIIVLGSGWYNKKSNQVSWPANNQTPPQALPLQTAVDSEAQIPLLAVEERRVRFAPDVVDEGAETGNEGIGQTEMTSEVVHGPVTEDGIAPVLDVPVKKKKAHRGTRGGKKNKKGPKPKEDADDEVDKIVDGVTLPKQGLQPDQDPAIEGNIADVEDSQLVKSIKVDTDRVLGYGSGGTTVYEGTFEGREVAVKRMLLQYYDLASQEIKLLSQSDDHPNVVRYYRHERDENFLYIAVERCQTSLWDLYKDGFSMDGLNDSQRGLLHEINSNMTGSLFQIAAGVAHLHSLRIIHRDVKPQNILVAYPKKNQTKGPRFVISDFGLCRMLQDNASTLVGTAGNAGTIGWKAPEVIGQPREGQGRQSSTNNDSNSSQGETTSPGVKRAVDIFSLGCVFYYVLTNGSHPFDNEDSDVGHVEREINIKKWDKPRLHKLMQWGEQTEEPRRLIEWMLEKRAEDRPTASQVMNHPFFWPEAKRLNFLCDVSDHWERECRDPPSEHLQMLEDMNTEHHITGPDFLAKLDRCFVDSLGRQRKYKGDRLLDLLRALRNKKNHYEDMDEFTKRKVGDLPGGYLRYWMHRFPGLLMVCYDAVRMAELEGAERFRLYLEEAG